MHDDFVNSVKLDILYLRHNLLKDRLFMSELKITSMSRWQEEVWMIMYTLHLLIVVSIQLLILIFILSVLVRLIASCQIQKYVCSLDSSGHWIVLLIIFLPIFVAVISGIYYVNEILFQHINLINSYKGYQSMPGSIYHAYYVKVAKYFFYLVTVRCIKLTLSVPKYGTFLGSFSSCYSGRFCLACQMV